MSHLRQFFAVMLANGVLEASNYSLGKRRLNKRLLSCEWHVCALASYINVYSPAAHTTCDLLPLYHLAIFISKTLLAGAVHLNGLELFSPFTRIS